MGNYSKAIAAILGGLVTMAGAFGIPVEWATPEVVTAVGTVITTVLVYIFPPNRAAE